MAASFDSEIRILQDRQFSQDYPEVDLSNLNDTERNLIEMGMLLPGDFTETGDPSRVRVMTPLSDGREGTLFIDPDNLGEAAAALPPKNRI